MHDEAGGALVIWHDVTPEAEVLVTEWYNREHHLERVRIPGFLSARRYEALSGSPKLFNLYRLRDAAVLLSPAYLECVNQPSETSLRAIPHCRRMIRTACDDLFHRGTGEGGFAGTWRLSAEPGREEALVAWLRETALPAMCNSPAVLSALLMKGNAQISGMGSSERKLRPDQIEPADLVIVVTGSDPESIRRTNAGALSKDALRAHGAAPDTAFGVYQLVFVL